MSPADLLGALHFGTLGEWPQPPEIPFTATTRGFVYVSYPGQPVVRVPFIEGDTGEEFGDRVTRYMNSEGGSPWEEMVIGRNR